MWQKQLHDDSDNQSETANDESASTSTIEDLLSTKPVPIKTETIEIPSEDSTSNPQQDNEIVASPTKLVETIELEEEEEAPKAVTVAKEESETTDNVNEDNSNTTTSGNSSSSPNNSNKKNKKKKSKSRSRSKF
jgi:hypothetical protein